MAATKQKARSDRAALEERNAAVLKFLSDMRHAAKNFTWHRGRYGELRARHKEHWGVFDVIGAVHFWHAEVYIEPWNELLWETPEAKALGSAACDICAAADAPWKFELGGKLLEAVGVDESFCNGR